VRYDVSEFFDRLLAMDGISFFQILERTFSLSLLMRYKPVASNKKTHSCQTSNCNGLSRLKTHFYQDIS
jgi:hypothetical protein